jgi:hypothetical protein
MLGWLTLRDFVWLLLLVALSLGWQLDGQVKQLEVSDQHDDARLFRADNLHLERQIQQHLTRIKQLERELSERQTNLASRPREARSK